MARQTKKAHALSLRTQLARDCFGWQWREDWEAWCPPGWPPISVINAPHMDKMRVLERHGGKPYGQGGAIDARGRPVIPNYQYHPEATDVLWDWLYAQPGIESIRFVPLPIPPGSLQGVTPWRCEILAAGERVVSGEGDGHQEALCYAVLALAKTQAAPVG